MRRTTAAAVVIGTLAMSGCTINSGGGPNGGNAAQAQSQIDVYNLQIEESKKIQEQQVAELERARKLLTFQEQQSERQDKLLSKLEEQARRQDAILDAAEQKAGIKQAKEQGPDTSP